MSPVTPKELRADKVDDVPGIKHVTLRGVRYTLREVDVVEYDECMKAVAQPDGSVLFKDLIKAITMKAVKPSPGSLPKPMPFPVYRTLEDMVNTMHYTDVPEDGTEASENGESPKEADPNP